MLGLHILESRMESSLCGVLNNIFFPLLKKALPTKVTGGIRLATSKERGRESALLCKFDFPVIIESYSAGRNYLRRLAAMGGSGLKMALCLGKSVP